jgi:hypothetical protein
MCIEKETKTRKERKKKDKQRKKERKKKRLTLGKATKVSYCIYEYKPFRVSQFQISLHREDWVFRLRA